MKLISTWFACLLLAVPALVRAQDAPPEDESMQTVQVSGVRDPAMMPYRDVYKLMQAVGDGTRDRVALRIRVTSARTRQPLAGLEIVLKGASSEDKLAISPTGFVDIPLSKQAYDERAEFVTNKRKGALRVEIFLVPKLPPPPMRYADIADAIQAAEAARVAVLPWYLRLLVPRVKAVLLCYPDAGQAVAIEGAGAGQRAARDEDTDTLGDKVYCARFSGGEKTLDAASAIVPPDGWRPLFR